MKIYAEETKIFLPSELRMYIMHAMIIPDLLLARSFGRGTILCVSSLATVKTMVRNRTCDLRRGERKSRENGTLE